MNNYTNKRKTNLLKRITTAFLSLTLVFGFFIACEGPEGPEGPAGEQGPEGPVGPAGEDGSMILAGTGAPSSDTGSIGDYYLDSDNAELYGPKEESGWGTPLSLQGPPGADGEDGSQIHSGTSAPDAGMGQPGDYFLNTSTFDLYGPKTNSGWGTPINLKGTANVRYSSWFEAGSWTSDGPDYAYFDESAPSVTQDIIDQGVVKAFAQLGGDNSRTRPLPATTINVNEIIWNFHIEEVGTLRFTAETIDGSSPNPLDSNKFRYVIIPGGESLQAKAKSLPIDLNNYEQVKKYFGIRD